MSSIKQIQDLRNSQLSLRLKRSVGKHSPERCGSSQHFWDDPHLSGEYVAVARNDVIT